VNPAELAAALERADLADLEGEIRRRSQEPVDMNEILRRTVRANAFRSSTEFARRLRLADDPPDDDPAT
jgi:hypothetical protein